MSDFGDAASSRRVIFNHPDSAGDGWRHGGAAVRRRFHTFSLLLLLLLLLCQQTDDVITATTAAAGTECVRVPEPPEGGTTLSL